MSLLFMDSFDGLDFSTKWDDSSGTTAVNTTNGLHGNSLQIGQNGTATKLLRPADEDDLLILAAHWYAVNVNGSILVLMADGATTTHITLSPNADGSLTVRRGTAAGTTLGTTTTGLIAATTWYHLGLKVLLHDSAGTVDVWLDGVNVLSLTGQDTKNGGTDAVFDSVRLFGPSTGGGSLHRYDNVYVMNGISSGISGVPNNDFVGPARVYSLLPTADSTPEQWTPSTGGDSTAVVDEATPNGDTDYISSNTAGHRSQFAMADLTDTEHTVYGVQATSYARSDDPGTAEFFQGISSDSVDADGATHSLVETYSTYLDLFEANPDGDIAWTPAAVNAAEFYVEVPA